MTLVVAGPWDINTSSCCDRITDPDIHFPDPPSISPDVPMTSGSSTVHAAHIHTTSLLHIHTTVHSKINAIFTMWTQGIRISGKHLYPLSHLDRPGGSSSMSQWASGYGKKRVDRA